MSKIICDLCGTSYPETESQCPICGTAKTDASKRQESTADNYAYVRGGRFSKENVRKRNSANQEAAKAAAQPKPQSKAQPKAAPTRERREPQEQVPSNKGLIVVVIILLVAIISVCAYIAIRFIDMSNHNGGGNTTSTQGSESKPKEIPCTGVSLSQSILEFTTVNKTILLQPILQPSDTTQIVFFSSSNEAVVKVDGNGLVTPVADGEAIISVICGGYQAECKVICNMGVEPPKPSDPTEPTNPSTPVDPAVTLKLNREEFMLNGYGDSWNLANKGFGYEGPDAAQVTWTSSDETVATVENGVVTAVGNGTITITAEYGDQKVYCTVYCRNVETPTEKKYEWNLEGYKGAYDISVAPGWSRNLYLRDKETKQKVEATLTVDDPTICSIEGGKVTALENTTGKTRIATITAEIDGEIYQYIIRVTSVDPDEA